MKIESNSKCVCRKRIETKVDLRMDLNSVKNKLKTKKVLLHRDLVNENDEKSHNEMDAALHFCCFLRVMSQL